MKVRVLSLKHREDLRDLLTDFMEYFGDKAEFHITEKEEVNMVQRMLDERLISWLGTGFRKSKQGLQGECGCFNTHINLWTECANQTEDYLMIEDSSLIDFDLLKEENFDCKTDITFYNQEFQISGNTLRGFGISAYKISPESATQLLRVCVPMTLPLDLMVRQMCNAGLISYSIGKQFVSRNNSVAHSTEDNCNDLGSRHSMIPLIKRIDEIF